MADDISQSRYRALGVPSQVWQLDNLWTAESSFTEQTPRPPEVEADQPGGFTLTASGTPTEALNYAVRVSRSGFPGPNGPGATWKYASQADTYYRGWDPPSWCTGYTPLWIDTGGLGIQSTGQVYVASTPTGELLTAYVSERTGPSYRIEVESLSPDGTRSTETVVSQSSAFSQEPHPCLLVMPSGDVIIVFWQYDSGDDIAYLQTYRRPAGETSWQLHQRYAGLSIDMSGSPGSAASGFDTGRLRGAVSRLGTILLCAEIIAHDTDDPRNHMVQCVSTDGGGTFVDVYQTTAGVSVYEGRCDVAAVGEQFVVAYFGGADNQVYFALLASAGQPLDESDSTALSLAWEVRSVSSNECTAEITAATDEDGAIYVMLKAINTSGGAYDNAFTLYRSPDAGLTWQPIGTSDAAVFGDTPVDVFTMGALSVSNVYPLNVNMTANAGRLVVGSNWSAGGTPATDLILWHLGGWSTAELPAKGAATRSDYRATMTYSWLPLTLLSSCGWTKNTSGTQSTSIEEEGQVVTTTSGQLYWNAAPGGSGVILAEMDVETDSGLSSASLAADECILRIRYSSGASDTVAKVRVAVVSSSIKLRLVDGVSGSAIGSDMTLTSTSKVQIRLWVDGQECIAYARSLDEFGADRNWIEIASTNSLTTTTVSGSDISVGTQASGTTASYWIRRVVYGREAEVGGTSLYSQTIPDDFAGRPIASNPMWMADGVYLNWYSGPGRTGDTYSLTAAAEFGIKHLFAAESRSPRAVWRGAEASPAAAEEIACAASTTLLGTDDSRPISDAVALLILGATARTGTLYGYQSSAWTSLASIDMASGMTSLAWTRDGATVRVTKASSTVWVDDNEFEGGVFKLGTAYRRIGKHRGGCLDPSTTGGPALILPLEGITGSEGTTGVVSGEIWSPNGVLVVYLLGQHYSGYKVVWDSQSTVAGYHQCGVLQLFDLELLRGPSYGWSRRTVDNVEESRADDGAVFTRELGPVREQLRIAFTDPTWTADPYDAPFWSASSSSGALATNNRAAQVQMLRGLIERIGGRDGACLFIHEITRGPPDSYMLLRRSQFLYCQGPGRVTYENITGDEGAGQLQRVPAITLEGVV